MSDWLEAEASSSAGAADADLMGDTSVLLEAEAPSSAGVADLMGDTSDS